MTGAGSWGMCVDLKRVEQMDATAHLPGVTVLGYHYVAPTLGTLLAANGLAKA
jgi:hypothetical protein